MIVLLSEVKQDVGEVDIFLLHFLVMTTALFCLSGSNKEFHGLEDLICASHVAVDEVLVVNLEKPMIAPVLLR